MAETRSIADLWDHLQEMNRHALRTGEDIVCGRDYSGNARFFMENCIAKAQKLRTELLERCKDDFDIEVRPISFGGEIAWKICNSRHETWDYFDSDQAINYGAAMQFLAWELEQRQREVRE